MTIKAKKLSIIALTFVFFNVISLTDVNWLKLMLIPVLFYFPGYGIIRALHSENLSKFMVHLLSVGLSLSYLMVLGLLLNLVIFIFHPNVYASELFALASVNIAIIFGLVKVQISHQQLHEITRSIRAKLLLLLSSLFVVGMVVLGVVHSNNGGGSSFALLGIFLSIAYIAYMIVKANKHDDITNFITLFTFGISVYIGVWLRSWLVSGVDVDREFGIFNYVLSIGYWSPQIYANAYNACLSITVLPQLLHATTHISSTTLFKFVLPFLGILVPIIIYGIGRDLINKRLAYLAGILYLSQPIIFGGLLIPIRQQLAFLFFALFTALYLSSGLSGQARRFLGIILGISVIVSHYSTSYVFLIILVVSLAVYRLKKYKYPFIGHRTVSIFILFLFFWYAQFGSGFDGLTQYIKTSASGFSKAFSSENQADGASFTNSFSVITGPQKETATVENYYDKLDRITVDAKLPPKPVSTSVLSPKATLFSVTERVLTFIKNGLSFFLPWLGLVGLVLLARKYRVNNTQSDQAYLLFNIAAILIYIIFLILPYITLSYDLNRLDQQLLILISPIILLGMTFLEKVNKYLSRHNILVSLYCLLFVVFSSGIIQQHFGGPNVSLRYNNSGLNYAKYYTVKADIVGAMWLRDNVSKNSSISADYFSTNRLSQYIQPQTIDAVNTNILLAIYQHQTYIFVSNINSTQGLAMNPYKGKTLVYSLPLKTINQEKNQLYSNGKSSVYK